MKECFISPLFISLHSKIHMLQLILAHYLIHYYSMWSVCASDITNYGKCPDTTECCSQINYFFPFIYLSLVETSTDFWSKMKSVRKTQKCLGVKELFGSIHKYPSFPCMHSHQSFVFSARLIYLSRKLDSFLATCFLNSGVMLESVVRLASSSSSLLQCLHRYSKIKET